MKILKCELCKVLIITEIEKYVHVEDWKCKRKIKSIWCHSNCFQKAMNRDSTQIEKQAREMLNQMQPVINKLTGQKEVYEVT